MSCSFKSFLDTYIIRYKNIGIRIREFRIYYLYYWDLFYDFRETCGSDGLSVTLVLLVRNPELYLR